VLESETDLSYERLLRLYKEVAGKSPSKGQLPFSTDWFMTWQPNIHASLFLNIHEYLNKVAELDEIDTVIKAYKLYTRAGRRAGAGAAAVGHPRLAAGEVRRQRHADDDQVQQVRRPLRDAPARDRPPLRVRPVQSAGACRQGSQCRRDPPARHGRGLYPLTTPAMIAELSRISRCDPRGGLSSSRVATKLRL
jgi:hypothetical protein